MLVGAVLAIPALLIKPHTLRLTPTLTAAFPTILLPGLAATLVRFWLVGRIGAIGASLFGVAIGLLREAIRPLDVLGVTIATAGILAVQVSRGARCR